MLSIHSSNYGFPSFYTLKRVNIFTKLVTLSKTVHYKIWKLFKIFYIIKVITLNYSLNLEIASEDIFLVCADAMPITSKIFSK